MKSSIAASYLLQQFIFGIIFLTFASLPAKASPISNFEHASQKINNQEYCTNIEGKFVIGLKPYITSSEKPKEDCGFFWYCRKINGSLELPVKPTKFDCAKADSSKPFYDASKCECVSTSNHCANNKNSKFGCTREYIPAVEPLESCRAFGKEGKYYSNLFAHYDDPTKFWNCGDSDKNGTIAHLQPCNENLVWDSGICACNYTSPSIHQTNIHPMNRFKCASEYRLPKPAALR